MSLIKKYFEKEKPKNDQIILVKAINSSLPEIGVYQIFENGDEEVYIPAYDDVEKLIYIQWWCEIPE